MPSVLSLPVYFTTTTQHKLLAVTNSARGVAPGKATTPQLRRLGSVSWQKGSNTNSAKVWWNESLASNVICCGQASNSSETTAADNGDEDEEGGMELSTFEDFVQLNAGCWGGHFHQFDVRGRTLQRIPTRLDAYAYGKGTDITLYHTLNVKEALSKTSVPGEIDEPTWAEFKLSETNLSTVIRPQQIAYFPGEGAYCLSHQTAEMLDKVLRKGVLGEDDDENEESPNGVKLPSRRPALVSESCLHSEDGRHRARVFIVLDPRGLLDVVGVFIEKKIEGAFVEVPSTLSEEDAAVNVDLLLGEWAGPTVTKRTGIYGSTVVKTDVAIKYKRLPGGFISQELSSSRGFKVNLTGQIKGSIFDFDGGLQTILLPGGIAVSAPISVGRSVGRSQSFFFEFSWMETPVKRRRLVRTFDPDGLVVSTTLSSEVKALV